MDPSNGAMPRSASPQYDPPSLPFHTDTHVKPVISANFARSGFAAHVDALKGVPSTSDAHTARATAAATDISMKNEHDKRATGPCGAGAGGGATDAHDADNATCSSLVSSLPIHLAFSAAEQVWSISSLRLGIAQHADDDTLARLVRVSKTAYATAVQVLYYEVDGARLGAIEMTWTDSSRVSLLFNSIRSILHVSFHASPSIRTMAVLAIQFPRLQSISLGPKFRLDWRRVGNGGRGEEARGQFPAYLTEHLTVVTFPGAIHGQPRFYTEGVDNAWCGLELWPRLPTNWDIEWKANVVIECAPGSWDLTSIVPGDRAWWALRLNGPTLADMYTLFDSIVPAGRVQRFTIGRTHPWRTDEIVSGLEFLRGRANVFVVKGEAHPVVPMRTAIPLYLSHIDALRSYTELVIPIGGVPDGFAPVEPFDLPAVCDSEGGSALRRLTCSIDISSVPLRGKHNDGRTRTQHRGQPGEREMMVCLDWLRPLAKAMWHIGGPTCEYDVMLSGHVDYPEMYVEYEGGGAAPDGRGDMLLSACFQREMEALRAGHRGDEAGWRRLGEGEKVEV